MEEKEQLILDLRRIRDNKYNLLEGESTSKYIDLMLKYIGDIDPELRDNLIYETFCEWICEKEYFDEKELKEILTMVMDDKHLFYHIGNSEDNTVFTRTFSVLVVALILVQHRKHIFLDYSEITKVKNTLIRYYKEEKDLRGYLEEYGWAHGAAHGADSMDELVQCSESDEAVYMEILNAFQAVLYNEKYLFSNEEDERMARAVYKIIKNNLLSYELINNWIEGLGSCCNWERTRSQYIARVNTKNFVRCLYFKLMHNKSAEEVSNKLLNVEAILNRFLQFD